MAKKATGKKSTSGRVAAKKTTKKPTSTAAATVTKVTTVSETEKETSREKKSIFPMNLPNIILAELIGTFFFTLATVAAFVVSPFMASSAGVLGGLLIDPLFIGLTLALLAVGVFKISGAHLNPAVTFGLWSIRRLKTALVPVYWLSQFLGALLAVGVVNALTGGQFSINLNSFAQFSTPVFFVELIGTAAFLFGIASIVSRDTIKDGAKALGVGLALTVGLIIGASLLYTVQKAAYQNYSEAATKTSDTSKVSVDRSLSINGPVLNPALALAAHEDSTIPDRLASKTTDTSKTQPSRFGLEVILGSLIGAAAGANLYLLITRHPKEEDEEK